MNTKHKHAEVIKAWADGAQIQCKQHDSDGSQWEDLSRPIWDECCEYRVKPAAPKWPETTMMGLDLYKIWRDASSDVGQSCIEIANAALRHACETGQLVPKDKADALYHIQQGNVVLRDCYEVAMRDLEKAQRALLSAGFVDNGAQEWRPPVNKLEAEPTAAIAGIWSRDANIETLRAHAKSQGDRMAELRADRADRDNAIAEAVAHAYQHAKYTIAGPDAVDLAAIIAGVKP